MSMKDKKTVGKATRAVLRLRLCAAVVLLLLWALVGFLLSRVSVKSFDVRNDSVYTDREIMDATGLWLGAPMFREEREVLEERILEELLADAYSGINWRGIGATQYTDVVNQYMSENGLGKGQSQENGTRQTNGPPAALERYSADEQSSFFFFVAVSTAQLKFSFDTKSGKRITEIQLKADLFV